MLEEGLSPEGGPPAFLLKLGECYLEMKRCDDAESALARGARAEARPRGRHYNLGLVHEGAASSPGRGRLRGGAARDAKRLSAPLQPGQAAAAAGPRRRRRSRRFREAVARRSRSSAPASCTWPRRCSTRATCAAPRRPRARAWRHSPSRKWRPSATTSWPTSTRARAGPPKPRARSSAARRLERRRAEAACRHSGPASRSALALLSPRGLRVPRRTAPPARAAPRPRHHRHAARRPPRLLRQPTWRRRTSTRIAREGALAPEARGPRPADAPVPRHDLHRPATRPSTASATTCRRRSGRACPCSPRSLKQRGLRDRRLRVVDRALAAVRARPRLRHLLGPLRRRGRRRAVPEHDPEARRRDRRPRPSPGSKPTRPRAGVFLWLHLYDPHDPYEPPEPYASRYADRPYDGEVACVGRAGGPAGRCPRAPRAPRRDRSWSSPRTTARASASTARRCTASSSTSRRCACPLLARGPGHPGRDARVTTTVRSVDLVPDGCSTCSGPRAPGASEVSGRSLAAALARRAGLRPTRPTYAESLTPLLHFGWSDLRVLREGRFKYIAAPRPELYDLKADPGELRNLAAVERRPGPRRCAAPSRSACSTSGARRAAPAAGRGGVPPELLEKLGALGYVGGGTGGAGHRAGRRPEGQARGVQGRQPLMREGLVHLREKDSAGERRPLRERSLRAASSRASRCTTTWRGPSWSLKRRAAAVPHFEAAIARLPAYGAAYTALADAWRGPGRAAARARRAAGGRGT